MSSRFDFEGRVWFLIAPVPVHIHHIHHTEKEDHTEYQDIIGVLTTGGHIREAEDSTGQHIQLERILSNQLTPTSNSRINLL